MLIPVYIFPQIDPIILHIYGPIAIRWYSLAYIAGIILGWGYANALIRLYPKSITKKHLSDFVTYAVLGIIIGGRLGHVIFYNPWYYFNFPLDVLKIYEGGMSFHGGLAGIITAAYLFCRMNHQVRFIDLTDIIAVVAPIGLFFGRIANFINAEAYGKVVEGEIPWAVIFPGMTEPRHPSQLYEAGLEGILLFLMMNYWVFYKKILRLGSISSGVFLMLYSVFRIIVERFREPEPQLGYLWDNITMGQLLCFPMMFCGMYLISNFKGPAAHLYGSMHPTNIKKVDAEEKNIKQ